MTNSTTRQKQTTVWQDFRWPHVLKRAVLCRLQTQIACSNPADQLKFVSYSVCSPVTLEAKWRHGPAYMPQNSVSCLTRDTVTSDGKSFPSRQVGFIRFRNFIHSHVTRITYKGERSQPLTRRGKKTTVFGYGEVLSGIGTTKKFTLKELHIIIIYLFILLSV